MLKFLASKGYRQGIFFLLLMMIVSCANDVITKHIGQRLDVVEVIFFRFFFSLVTMLPFIINRGTKVFKTSLLTFNLMRGVLGAVSFYLYAYSIMRLQIVEVVTILWTIPLFVLILSIFFLKESVNATRWCATIVGFVGLAFITLYDSEVSFSLKFLYFIPAAAAFLFAVQDVMIKKMVDDNCDSVTMLLYFSIVTTVLSVFPMIYVWKTPTLFELTMLALYGLFANLMQYFIFRAFNATDLSALAPFRYVEFLLSSVAGFLFFQEVPRLNVLIGACILIPSTLYLAYNENSNSTNKMANEGAA
jgi:S-adenosylmethionine uptake transporter